MKNGTHEKRRALRYVPGRKLELHFSCGKHDYTAPLNDISSGGLMTLVSESDARRLGQGTAVFGEISLPEGALAWEGRIVHHSPTTRGTAIGVASHGSSQAMRAAAAWLADEPTSGALHLQRGSEYVELEVIGRLSFEIARDFLCLIRQSDVSRIDLSRCTSVDSSGLGMLSIARELQMPIIGACGMVATLLDIARLSEPRHP